jgi:hypothetical protein
MHPGCITISLESVAILLNDATFRTTFKSIEILKIHSLRSVYSVQIKSENLALGRCGNRVSEAFIDLWMGDQVAGGV